MNGQPTQVTWSILNCRRILQSIFVSVEKVYSNEVFEIALCMLVANFILVLLMTFPLSHYLLLLRDNMTVLIASRAALVLSFLTLLSLRTYFRYFST